MRGIKGEVMMIRRLMYTAPAALLRLSAKAVLWLADRATPALAPEGAEVSEVVGDLVGEMLTFRVEVHNDIMDALVHHMTDADPLDESKSEPPGVKPPINYGIAAESEPIAAQVVDHITEVQEPTIECPHCEYEFVPDFNDGYGYLITYWGDDGPKEIECEECDRAFRVKEHVLRWHEVLVPRTEDDDAE
jgi:hypothetical protein